MKKLSVILLVLVLILPVFAHEFWLKPNQFKYNKNDNFNLSFFVGENFDGTPWKAKRYKMKTLDYYELNTKINLLDLLIDTNKLLLNFALKNEGTKMVTFNNNNSFIAMEAKKFNAYLLEDGLTNAIAFRKKNNLTDSSSKEFYQRSVKTIFQVGHKTDNTILQPTNLPLDIIPQQNPYALKNKSWLKVQILFKQKPLANYKIILWHKTAKTISTNLISDKNGFVSFPVILKGVWMVSTVKIINLENNQTANWQSYWGSCTWGYN